MNAEWKHLTARFFAFLSRIQPAAGELAAAREAAAEVAGLLARRFAGSRRGPANAGCEYRIVGGHAKGTAVRAVSAIDLLFVLPARLRPDARQVSVGADAPVLALMDDAIAVLGARYAGVQLGRDGWLSVVLPGPGGGRALPVRLMPCFACAAGGYLMAVSGPRNRGGRWRHLDPAAEAENLATADAISEGKASHLIRMLKVWQRTRRVPIQPFALELLAVDFASRWLYQRQSVVFYDWLVRDFFFWLVAQRGRRLAVPGGYEELAIGDAWLARAEAAYVTAALAADFERDNRDERAVACWRELFGHEFAAAAAEVLPGAAKPPRLLLPVPS
jgi:hypothetical protein